MSTKYNVNYKALCPFYKGDLKNEIVCEGVYDTGTTVSTFPSKSIREEYMDLNCNCYWEQCLIAQAMLKKYGEGEKTY